MEEQIKHTILPYCFTVVVTVLLFVCVQHGASQTIQLIRSDVDTGRASFITATQMFGVDVVIDGVPNCTGVSFELRYNNAQHVVFSNIKARDFSVQNAFIVDLSDSASGQGSIHASVLSGASVSEKGVNNPHAFHIDFVVRSSAPNSQLITFTFVDAQAVTTDSGGMIKQLTPITYQTKIHGFVNVFPGDANNDGKVTAADGTTVGAYLGQGSGASNVRGYKREPSSTLWLPQRSLVWDSASATYADCDGSGDVTIADQLVVQINFGQVHSSIKPDDDIKGIVPTPTATFPTDATRSRLYISTDKKLLGVAMSVKVPQGSQILGFEPSPDYPEAELTMFKYDEVSSTVYLGFGSVAQQNILSSGNIGSLVFGNSQSYGSTITEAYGATKNGSIFPLQAVTSVEETNAYNVQVYPQPATSAITLQTPPNSFVTIYSYLGQAVVTLTIPDNSQTFSVASLPNGTYHAVITNGNHTHRIPFVVLH